ncbi:MAG: Cd(II)/Pb(II)-responsive transcriptional regulator [Halothiobacillaceae bacterium]|nr:Cd(II)/Pb(II)-responsive transcriptional regulator [Halothiobacillaceae bacterium]OYY56269.1 MAG: Cd(II)/Pb(II)-responsive transcriptional regulator [Halothiobacillus sp. 28-55-5]HUN00736.1 Cd(II)/Pb(II)-responsive transcriptional regulator [Halothiobacillus sp.]
MKTPLKIGELAAQCGVALETIRYYEKTGLLPAPTRTANGYRAYGAAHVKQLAFIRHCRALDMPLADIAALQQFADAPNDDCGKIDALIETHLTRVHERLASLKKLEHQLLNLRAACASGRCVQECGILHELVAAAQGDSCVCHTDTPVNH